MAARLPVGEDRFRRVVRRTEAREEQLMTMEDRRIRFSVPALALLALAGPAWARPRIEIAIGQAREVVTVDGGGKTTKLVPSQTASPGDVVQYALSYTNKGDEVARDAVVDDPIPKGTTFVANSAAGEGAEIRYSIDGGKTFAPAEQLTQERRLASGQTEKRLAAPSEYTHVRWIIKQVPPGASGVLTFRVRVN
jgi:uncharacterized repeat protein (TIGR01451 family)